MLMVITLIFSPCRRHAAAIADDAAAIVLRHDVAAWFCYAKILLAQRYRRHATVTTTS